MRKIFKHITDVDSYDMVYCVIECEKGDENIMHCANRFYHVKTEFAFSAMIRKNREYVCSVNEHYRRIFELVLWI